MSTVDLFVKEGDLNLFSIYIIHRF